MYHDETPFNVSTSFPYVGVQADCPYGPTYAPLMRSAPTIGPAIDYDVGFQQAQSRLSAPVPSTITQSPGPNVTYREIRPKPPHNSIPISPLPGTEDEEKHKQHQALGSGRHSKHRGQLGHEQVQRTAKKARRTESEVTDTATLSARDDGLRFAWLYFRTCVPPLWLSRLFQCSANSANFETKCSHTGTTLVVACFHSKLATEHR